MPALSCPSCGVRLTLGADRAGATVACPKCRSPITVRSGSESQPPKSKIEFLCPFCTSKLSISMRKAGAEVKCPQCQQSVIVPTPVEPPRMGILVNHAPQSAPPPPPASLKPKPATAREELPSELPPPPQREVVYEESAPDDEDEGFDFSFLKKQRRSRRWLARVWRVATLSALGVALICFFLPWMRYTVYVPGNKFFERGPFEFASQSGLGTAFGLSSMHPAIEAVGKRESAIEDLKWRREGKNPTKERLRENLPYTAIWLLLYPIGLGLAGAMTFISSPDKGMLRAVSVLLVLVLLLLFIQFGIFGSPALAAMYDELAKDEFVTSNVLLMSLLLEVHYTPWFTVAVMAIVSALLIQLAVGAVPRR